MRFEIIASPGYNDSAIVLAYPVFHRIKKAAIFVYRAIQLLINLRSEIISTVRSVSMFDRRPLGPIGPKNYRPGVGRRPTEGDDN